MAKSEETGAPAAPEGEPPEEQRRYLEAILGAMRQPLVVLNGDLRVETANDAFYTTFEISPDETEGRLVYELGNRQWDIPDLRKLLEDILPNNGEVRDFKVEHEFERIGRRVMVLNAHRMERGGRDDRILFAIDDTTEREQLLWELEGQKEYAEKIVDASHDALLILGWDLRVKTANETFYTTFKVDPAETEDKLVYELGNGQWDIPQLRELLENVLPDNDTFDDFLVEHDFEEIGRRTMVLNARRLDHTKMILLAIEDETEARRSAAFLRESEAQFRVLVETTAQAVWEADANGVVVTDSPSWRAFTGQTTDEWLGTGWADAVHPDDRDFAEGHWRESVAAGHDLDAEFRLRRAEGGWRWTHVRAAPVRDDDGRILKWVGMNTDISPRKEAEEQRELLLGELNHRVKNIFAVIRSLASQSDGERSADEFREAFLGRLDALINAHKLALDSRWQSIGLGRLAGETLRPYAADRPDAVEIGGSSLELPPRTFLSLGLVLHERATNAVKYGALSRPEGRVRLSWGLRDDGANLRLEWQESGGPPASAPERPGFGTRLVSRVFEYELGGGSELHYRQEGLHLEAWFPLD